MFKMSIAYEGTKTIDTNDLLTALKIAQNYEADLYNNGSLIFSAMGLTHEDNERLLNDKGIKMEVVNNRICYKYMDESKNKNKYYASFFQHDFYFKDALDVKVNDYKEHAEMIEFDSLEDIRSHIKQNYKKEYILGNVSGSIFFDGGCTSFLMNENDQRKRIEKALEQLDNDEIKNDTYTFIMDNLFNELQINFNYDKDQFNLLQEIAILGL